MIIKHINYIVANCCVNNKNNLLFISLSHYLKLKKIRPLKLMMSLFTTVRQCLRKENFLWQCLHCCVKFTGIIINHTNQIVANCCVNNKCLSRYLKLKKIRPFKLILINDVHGFLLNRVNFTQQKTTDVL